ncbi:MAG: PKD domain-containing protein [Chthoniobacterales bacterium]
MFLRIRHVALVCVGVLLAPTVLRSDCSLTSIGVRPLNDAGPRLYKNFPGGLYPRGANSPPPAQAAAALALAGQIQPLDANGAPNASSGRIVLLSIGMSNTTQEFASAGLNSFKPRADADPSKNPRVVIVDGAQGGQDASRWLDPNAMTWNAVNTRLANAGVTAQQVQAVWLKQALAGPNNLGAFPEHAQILQSNLETIARNAKTRYPNAKLLYLASRTRAYTDVATSLNPEPFAFESSYSVKWAIENQIAGRNNLNWNSAAGAVVAPLLLWGPYLWGDGTVPRSDGFIWECQDVKTDFTHPSANTGVGKVAAQLLAFFKTDASAAPWFLNGVVAGQPPTVNATADVMSGDAPLSVNFSASAIDPDGTIASYQWTFEDGTFSTAQNPVKDFPAPGNYHTQLTVTDNSGNTVRRTIPILVKLSLAEWRRIHFSAAELKDAAISGNLADPEGDGLTNLAEYKLGTNPKLPDASVCTAQSAAGQLTLTYPRAKYAAEGTTAVEVASNPNGPWSAGAGATSEQTTADDGIVQTVVATDLAQGAAARFMRLRIER